MEYQSFKSKIVFEELDLQKRRKGTTLEFKSGGRWGSPKEDPCTYTVFCLGSMFEGTLLALVSRETKTGLSSDPLLGDKRVVG